MRRTTSAPHEANAEVFDVVHARILRFFPDLVEQLGGDAMELFAKADIDTDNLSRARSSATYRQLVHLIELAAAELNCPDFGMRLATLQSGRMFGPLGLVMKNSRTFGEALDYVSRHAEAHSSAARIWQKRLPSPATTSWSRVCRTRARRWSRSCWSATWRRWRSPAARRGCAGCTFATSRSHP